MTFRWLRFFAVVPLALAAAFCSRGQGGSMLNGAGATFPYPLYSAWSYDYSKKTGIRLNYQSIGSGGGVKQIVARTVAFGATDDALPVDEVKKHNLLQWPQVVGGIVVIYNVAGLGSEEVTLDARSVCGIFLGDIKKWNDPALRALNGGRVLPNAPITVVHRSDGSGTTAVFTHYLGKTCPDWQKRVGQGKSVKWPVGIGGKGNEGVANYVKKQPNSIGYVEFAYAEQNRIAHALLRNSAGKVVKPSLDTFSAAAASGDYNPENHFYTWITNAPAADAWPIVAATNILVAKEKVEENKRVVQFFEWAFSPEGDAQARRLVYAPLPDALKKRIREYWKKNGIQ